MEHVFVLYGLAKESLNAKSLPANMQELWFSYHAFLWHLPPPPTYRLTFNQLRLAFAMTINKAQGQTLKHVGLCLTEPIFTHGQLYVAVSRVIDGANLRIIVPDTPEACREEKIKNVVYSEVFS
jgi:hypothetical protein